jgi:hypothetical protein
MEPEGSLPHSQQSTTCPILSKTDPVHAPHLTPLRSILILPSNLHLGLSSGLLHSGSPTKTFYVPLRSPIRATRPAHLSTHDLITQIMFDEEYRG